MSRNEITNERPTDYSKWHRTLPNYCKAQDIDWIEYRIKDEEPTPVAIIETGRWNRSNFVGNQILITRGIAEKLGIPVYFVEYSIDKKNYDKNVFKIQNLDDLYENNTRIMSNVEYSNFIKQL